MAAVVLMVAAVSVSAKVVSDHKAKADAGDKPKVEEKRALKGFERIEQLGSVDVKYRQGKDFSVVVKAPKADIKDVMTRVEGNCLIVSMKSRMLSLGSRGDDVTVYVTSPDLIGVMLKGSGDFECKTHLDTDNLSLTLNGSGDIEFTDIICDRLDISVVGSGDAEVKKVVSRQTAISLVGSGDVKVSQQKVDQTRIELKGSGDVKVHNTACGTVDARLQGSGDITLSGDIAKYNVTKRGSGDVNTGQLTVRK